MGKPTGFKEFQRETPPARPPQDRVKDFREIYLKFGKLKTRQQAARCMDCGIPFCHQSCPLGNDIPDFNDAIYRGDWTYAYKVLTATNNFPEFTGRICPAPCEASCVLGLNEDAVSIELIEKKIIEEAFKRGLVRPQLPKKRTAKTVAVVGSGPAGLAAAAQLNQAGHLVTVFERDEQIGGLLRFGIPDFKLEKRYIDRRISLLEKEGIQFKTGVNVGFDISMAELERQFDAILLCCGALKARDLPIPGRDLKGVEYAMDYLTDQNRQLAGLKEQVTINAENKHVVVIGGGDTGADCVGTANRQGALSVTQLAYRDQPPTERSEENPWPEWPMILQTSSSHEEGCDRQWGILTKAFLGDESGHLRALKTVEVRWEVEASGKRGKMKEIPGTEKEIPCQLTLLAVGFLHTEHDGPVSQAEIALSQKGHVKCANFQTNQEKIFAAGDMRRGQSLVVWAIHEGRQAARAIDMYLMGSSRLPAKTSSMLEA